MLNPFKLFVTCLPTGGSGGSRGVSGVMAVVSFQDRNSVALPLSDCQYGGMLVMADRSGLLRG